MIGHWSVEETARLLGAVRVEGAGPFAGVSTDSRTLRPGELYLALQGERFDGHDFAREALAKGAAGVLTQRWLNGCAPQIQVEDTLQALGELGAINRQRFVAPVVAVTGSNGKTSVKEMTKTLLGALGPVHATRGNLNNAIGVPLTLLGLTAEARSAVIELGASAEGEIAWTTSLARPDVAILNNARGAHLEGFGSLEAIVRAKGEIFSGLSPEGTAVVNADDPNAAVWLRTLRGRRVVRFSAEGRDVEVRAEEVDLDARGCATFRLRIGAESAMVQLAVMGRHMVANALAAASAAHALGLDTGEIALRLGRYRGVAGRLAPREGILGCRVIDDTYNANPASVRAAIDLLASLPGRRTLVLGDMAELGAEAESLHAELGDYARANGIDRFVGVGPLASVAAERFGGSACDDWQAAVEWMHRDGIGKEDVILVKGSRSARMERVVEALVQEENN